MSQTHGVHVGPFAEWLLPPARADDLPEELYTFLLDDPPGGVGLTFHDNPPRVRVDGVEYARKFWSPYFAHDAAEAPPRRFEWGDVYPPGADDLSAVVPAAEVEWFRTRFAEQLRRLSDLYGGEPTLRWGVISAVG